MAREKGRAKPRRERNWPQVERVYSTNFLEFIERSDEKCFVPLSDYRKLQKRYFGLLNRYKRNKNGNF
jgi:hypothetical protein